LCQRARTSGHQNHSDKKSYFGHPTPAVLAGMYVVTMAVLVERHAFLEDR